jgi:hypothetical protein
MPVAAQSSSNPVDDLFTDADGEPVSPWEDPRAFASSFADWATGASTGLADRIAYQSARFTGSDTTDLDAERNASIETINDNSGVITDYLNNQTTLNGEQVHAVKLVDEFADQDSTFYLTLSYNETTDELETIEATVDQPANTTVDHEHRAKGQFAANFDDELTMFVEDYALTDTSALSDGNYVGRMASQYGGVFGNQFESTLLDDGFEGFEDDGADE